MTTLSIRIPSTSLPFRPNNAAAAQTVFHGNRVVVEEPRILPSRYTKDFGPGFYCTVLREQAEEVSSD